MDGQHRIEQVRETDAVRLRDEAEEAAVAVEAPRPPDLDHFDAWLVVAVEQLVGDFAVRGLIVQLEGFGAEPLRAHHRDQRVRQNAADGRVRQELFELGHCSPLFRRWPERPLAYSERV